MIKILFLVFFISCNCLGQTFLSETINSSTENSFKVLKSDTFVYKSFDTTFTEIVQVQSKRNFVIEQKIFKQTETFKEPLAISIVKKEECLKVSTNDCVVPPKEQWKLTTTKITEPIKHRIQFLSIQVERKIDVPFKYYMEYDGCFRRYYFDEDFDTLQDALKELPNIKKHYFDAFPISFEKRKQQLQ